MGISFSEPERLKEIFDSSNREEWQKTSHILRTLDLKDDDIIADIGAGTGYFSNIFSQEVKNGRVYAIDCEPNMVCYMKNRFSENECANIQTILSRADDPCIPSDTNIVFLANTYRFIQERDTFLLRIREQTGAETKFVFVDFRGSHARISQQMAMEEVKNAGFEVMTVDSSGCPDHYILIFKKYEREQTQQIADRRATASCYSRSG